jgi:hypothetical protein
MMRLINRLRKILLIFIVVYLVQFAFVGTFLISSYTHRAKSDLDEIASAVQSDISYKDGLWDMSKYNADSDIPGRFRVSIFSLDGFVVERWRPIPGLLDTSDFKRLLSYDEPQTIDTITQQTWRIYSEPIKSNTSNTVIGVISVSKYAEDGNFTRDTDAQLHSEAKSIKSHLTVLDDTITTGELDVKTVPFDVAFQVVNQFNTIIIKNNNGSSMDRIPNFIDSSYIKKEISNDSFRNVKSTEDPKESFIVKSFNLNDEKGQPFGVGVVATTRSIANSLVRDYAIASFIMMVVLTTGYLLIRRRLSKPKIEDSVQKNNLLSRGEVETIGFDKKNSSININNQVIPISYSTNQYYLCEALFSSPKKKWETDELADKFGIELTRTGWRKIYDAMVSVNTKVSSIIDDKLIICSNKTYRINPDLLDRIKK